MTRCYGVPLLTEADRQNSNDDTTRDKLMCRTECVAYSDFPAIGQTCLPSHIKLRNIKNQKFILIISEVVIFCVHFFSFPFSPKFFRPNGAQLRDPRIKISQHARLRAKRNLEALCSIISSNSTKWLTSIIVTFYKTWGCKTTCCCCGCCCCCCCCDGCCCGCC